MNYFIYTSHNFETSRALAVAALNFDYRGPLPDDLNCNVTVAGNQADSATMGASIMPKISKISVASQMENSVSVSSDKKIRDLFFGHIIPTTKAGPDH